MEYFKKYFKDVDGRDYVALSNGKIYNQSFGYKWGYKEVV